MKLLRIFGWQKDLGQKTLALEAQSWIKRIQAQGDLSMASIRAKRQEEERSLVQRVTMERKMAKETTTALETMTALAKGYQGVANLALETATKALAKVEAIEANTHRVQYVPTSVAQELKAMVDKADGSDENLLNQVKSYKNPEELETALDDLDSLGTPPDI